MAGRYKILEHLGAGGVGEVFKAFDTQLDRYVAIKRLLSREESETSDSMTSTLRKEAASLATLQHPNIVSVYDLSSDDVGMFIVMELLEGDTLNDWLKNGNMDLLDFKEFATQTLEGILSAHQVNILHRDLKPENIKMNRLPGGRLQAKIVDFGLARMSYAARKQTEDQSGNVLGSIFYMAPEQFLRKALDGRSDLYSLGCVYYQCLSGRRPFDGETVHAVMDAHLQHLVYDLKELCPHVPGPICEWVMWLINADQAHRPANARAALDHLRALVDAGWFAVAEAIPVAVPAPVVTQAPPTRTTGQTPAVRPPSGSVKPPTGLQPPARTTGFTRSLGSNTAALRGSQPLPAKSAVSVAVAMAEEGEMQKTSKAKFPMWAIPAAVVVLAIVGWVVFGHKTSVGGPVASASSTPPAYPEMPRDKDMLLHFVANRASLATNGNAGKDEKLIKWNDLRKGPGSTTFFPALNEPAAAPTLRNEKLEKMKAAIYSVHFEINQRIGARASQNTEPSKLFPFGSVTKEKGLTVIMVLRTEGLDGGKPTTCLRISSEDFKTFLFLRYFPENREFRALMKADNLYKEAKINRLFMGKGFAIVSIVLDGKAGKMALSGRSSDSGRGRAESDMPQKDPAKMQLLNGITIGAETKANPLPEDYFKGDLAELQLYSFPMNSDDRSLTEQTLAEYYFKDPGARYGN